MILFALGFGSAALLGSLLYVTTMQKTITTEKIKQSMLVHATLMTNEMHMARVRRSIRKPEGKDFLDKMFTSPMFRNSDVYLLPFEDKEAMEKYYKYLGMEEK